MSTKLRHEADRSKLPDMVGAVIYVRVSTKEQTENLSLPTQLKACEEYCQRQGFHVLARFREEGESAKTADRPSCKSSCSSAARTRAGSSSSSSST
jgi:DNA invertase Pin-like site-specific DNA recombinase